MNKTKMSEQLKLFLNAQGIDSNNYKYISKDCESYKVKNISNGVIGYIRY